MKNSAEKFVDSTQNVQIKIKIPVKKTVKKIKKLWAQLTS
jgi:hypothetical protein